MPFFAYRISTSYISIENYRIILIFFLLLFFNRTTGRPPTSFCVDWSADINRQLGSLDIPYYYYIIKKKGYRILNMRYAAFCIFAYRISPNVDFNPFSYYSTTYIYIIIY